MIRHEHDGLIYYTFENMPTLKHGIFARVGGVSDAPWQSLNLGGNVGDTPDALQENYRRIYTALNANGARACSVWQVHSADTIVVSEPATEQHWIAQADGMVTEREDTPLVMRFADCVPVLMYDPEQRVIGMAHAGWRGTVQGAARSVIDTMVRQFGSRPASIVAGIGPSIGPECYQVGQEVVDAVQRYFGSTAGLIRIDAQDDSAYLNLWAANTLDLQRAGVEQIEVAEICTASNVHEFFSHRAENGKTGRFAAVMTL